MASLFDDENVKDETWESWVHRRLRRVEYGEGVLWKAWGWLLFLAVVEAVAIIVLAVTR
jgi:hypothetical protein